MNIPIKHILGWVGAVCAAATPPAVILALSVLYIQATFTSISSAPPTTTNEHTQYLSQQEPFTYSTKVYISLDHQIQANAAEFFESAQQAFGQAAQAFGHRSILSSLLSTPVLIDVYILLRMRKAPFKRLNDRFGKKNSLQQPTLELAKDTNQPLCKQRAVSMRKSVHIAALL
ncbi:hypothetical protein BX667DRAFT_530905 [Coemansia mojavensis]|nr:hypothetical protein BX667DRAFT_530905 [Coemansia mojavensis]